MGTPPVCIGAALAMFATLAARAEEAARQAGSVKNGAQKLRDLGLAGGSVEGPGVGRLLLAFVLVAALAWGATWVLKRYGFRSGRAAAGGASPIRHLSRGALPGGIACHVVEAQGRQVLITVTRHGVTSLLLGDAVAPPPPTSAASAP